MGLGGSRNYPKAVNSWPEYSELEGLGRMLDTRPCTLKSQAGLDTKVIGTTTGIMLDRMLDVMLGCTLDTK